MFNQINVISRDMSATLAFYRKLGLAIAVDADSAHASVNLPNGVLVEFDAAEFVPKWDSGWNGSTGSGVVLGFAFPSRDAVDVLYADLIEAGYRKRQRPYDAFWGARYAIVEDPDGNGVGLMSPVDKSRKFWPPGPLPD